jgi:hypothetical protein
LDPWKISRIFWLATSNCHSYRCDSQALEKISPG